MKLHSLLFIHLLYLLLASRSEAQQVQVDYTLITANSPDCVSSPENYTVRVEHWSGSGGSWTNVQSIPDHHGCEMESITNDFQNQIALRICSYSLKIPCNGNSQSLGSCGRLRFTQENHRGGFCDCWAVAKKHAGPAGNLTCGSGNLTDEFKISDTRDTVLHDYINSMFELGGCKKSASAPREMFLDVTTDASLSCPNTSITALNTTSTSDMIRKRFNIGESCSASFPRVEVSFNLKLTSDDERSQLDFFDEGVEFAFRTRILDDWIPLAFYAPRLSVTERKDVIIVGKIFADSNLIEIRGYNVSYDNNDNYDVRFTLCGDAIDSINDSSLQFRWLQTVRQKCLPNADTVYLDNVSVVLKSSSQHATVLLEDNFDDQITISGTKWIQRHVSLNHTSGSSQDKKAQFGSCRPIYTPLGVDENHATATIISREMSTVWLSPSHTPPQITYTLITADSPNCLGHSTAPVQLQYRLDNTEWTTLDPRNAATHSYDTTKMAHIQVTIFTVDLDSRLSQKINNNETVAFRFVQWEHRGGYCDCWGVANLKVGNKELNETCWKSGQHEEMGGTLDTFLSEDNNTWTCNKNAPPYLNSADMVAEFCQGSASVLREFGLFYGSHGNPCNTTRTSPHVPDNKRTIPIRTNCSNTELRIELTFDLQLLPSGGCDSIDSFHEGVELSVRSLVDNDTREWLPLMFFTGRSNLANENGDQSFISLAQNISKDTSTSGSLTLRGYTVPYFIESEGHHSISLCTIENILQHPFEFRWLQTSLQDNVGIRDVIILDNVTISSQSRTRTHILFRNNFDHQTTTNELEKDSVLTRDNIHLASSVDNCGLSNDGKALFFYAEPDSFQDSNNLISSRQVVIGPFDVDISQLSNQEEESVLDQILGDEKLTNIFNLIKDSPDEALKGLDGVLAGNGSSSIDLTAATYLLSAISNQYGESIVDSSVSKAFLSVANNLLKPSNAEKDPATETQGLGGSTLLNVLDSFALNNFNASDDASQSEDKSNIVVRVYDVFLEKPISEEGVAIKIPREVLGSGGPRVRMASFLFRNMSGLLPGSIEGTDDTSDADNKVESRLVSPVISTSFSCVNCTTSNLKTPVQVTFNLSAYDEALFNENPNGSEIKCVFWKFNEGKGSGPQAVLYPGQWSDEGCKTRFTSNMAVCDCNHLTHFAILLSSRPLNFSQAHTLGLEIISSVGVSISLVAMLMTILVFIYLNCTINRPLYKMRNYIHIQLCVSLGIAQIIFVAGIKPHLEEGKLVGGVPLGCRLVAVLLHYWFLVSFMWMLMEGVVLYVALVRVFVKRHGLYVLAFTLASYGLPLLYVGGLTVPLGFARTEEMRVNQTYDYGYKEACYLNPATSFIWSLIVPVALIFIANIGFFIMAVVIMCRHQRNSGSKKRAKRVKHWLKACISLSMVMGITWIIGFLVTEFEGAIFLAYIFTFFVAFQGLSIFIIFVILSERKRIKDSISKWWKSKLGESEFLSKHFGDKSFATTTSSLYTQQVPMSQLGDRDNLDQRQEPNAFTEEEPLQDETPGTSFDVVFVPVSKGLESATLEDAMETGSLSSCNQAEDQSLLINTSHSSLVEMQPEIPVNRTVYIMTGGRPAAVVESCKGSAKDSGVEKNGELRAKPNVYVDCTDVIHSPQHSNSSSKQ